MRQFDWKVFARTDKSFVKKYEGDTNTRLYLLLDCSRSMAFSSQKVSKFDYGRYLAASLAYLARRQQDAVGLLMFNSRRRQVHTSQNKIRPLPDSAPRAPGTPRPASRRTLQPP